MLIDACFSGFVSSGTNITQMVLTFFSFFLGPSITTKKANWYSLKARGLQIQSNISTPSGRMDIVLWQSFLAGNVESPFNAFYASMQTFQGGRRVSWALNLMRAVGSALGGSDDPRKWPRDATAIRTAVDGAVNAWSRKMQLNALHALRIMLQSHDDTRQLADLVPRYLRQEAADVVRRQRYLVKQECIPANVDVAWCRQLFLDLVDTKRGRWRTTIGARQELHMLHKFLRSTGWLAKHFDGLQQFRDFVRNDVSDGEIRDVCQRFMDGLNKAESRSRYVHILRLFFVRYLGRTLEREFDSTVHQSAAVFETLQDMDEWLSNSSGDDRRTRPDRKHFTSDEVERLMRAQTAPLARLVVVMLATTGLRRRGLLNVHVSAVATFDDKRRCWVAQDFGTTLTKGIKRQAQLTAHKF